MEIKIAQISDIEAILRLQRQVYRTQKPAENASRLLEDEIKSPFCDVLVTVEGNHIVASGFLYYINVPLRGQQFAFMEGLVVDDSVRGQGIGSKMIMEFINLARRKDCYKIIFTSGFDRQNAHNLYEKLGFKKWGFEFRMDL